MTDSKILSVWVVFDGLEQAGKTVAVLCAHLG